MPANKPNKIKYGVKNVHVAKVTETLVDGTYTYEFATPVSLPGARSISMEPQGELNKWYADNTVYYTSNDNTGYEGDLEVAMLPDWFLTDILHEVMDTNGVLVEVADGQDPTMFALLFEFQGDKKAIRHVMYCCTASRPKAEGDTKEEAIDPKTDSITITAIPRKDNAQVKSKTTVNTTDNVYTDWYKSVYEPSIPTT